MVTVQRHGVVAIRREARWQQARPAHT
jgi:hypothetical protein